MSHHIKPGDQNWLAKYVPTTLICVIVITGFALVVLGLSASTATAHGAVPAQVQTSGFRDFIVVLGLFVASLICVASVWRKTFASSDHIGGKRRGS